MTDDFRKDMYLLIDGELFYVVDRKYKTQGRQGGLIILDLKNLKSGNNVSKTVKAGTKFEQAEPEYREMQYLYSDGTGIYFMDTETYATESVPTELIGDYKNYLKEGDRYVVLFYEGRAINMRRNPSVKLQVTEAADAVKGNTANSATKIVKTESGYQLNVPMFIKQGDVIVINTETGEYSGRA